MRIILTKTLSKEKGLVRGAVRDWPRPLITQMTQDLASQDPPITEWFSYDAGEEERFTKMRDRAAARPDLLSAPPDEESVTPPTVEEPTSMAEALLREKPESPGQSEAHRAAMVDAPRAQRGPGRPPKNPALEPA